MVRLATDVDLTTALGKVHPVGLFSEVRSCTQQFDAIVSDREFPYASNFIRAVPHASAYFIASAEAQAGEHNKIEFRLLDRL